MQRQGYGRREKVLSESDLDTLIGKEIPVMDRLSEVIDRETIMKLPIDDYMPRHFKVRNAYALVARLGDYILGDDIGVRVMPLYKGTRLLSTKGCKIMGEKLYILEREEHHLPEVFLEDDDSLCNRDIYRTIDSALRHYSL